MNNKDSIKDLLKDIIVENLSVKVEKDNDYNYDKLKVSLLFDGKVIDSDYINVTEGIIKF